MRRKNHKAADGGKTKAQAADARRTVRKTGYSALKNKGVSFFQRLSRHNKGSKEQGTAPASAAVPVSEDASPLYYIIHGPRADKAGTSNMLNAVKRMAGGIQLQAQYCRTAEDTARSLFDAQGNLHCNDILLEVPAGQGEQVRTILKAKASQGLLRNKNGQPITDPACIDAMVQEGSITYKQAENIARSGMLDAVSFDEGNGAVTCSCALGLSFAVGMACALWAGKTPREAVIAVLRQTVNESLSTLVLAVASRQLPRTSVGQMGKRAAEYAAQSLYGTPLGQFAMDKLASYSLQKGIYGAAAVEQVSHLLHSEVITNAVTATAEIAPDFYRAAIAGTASWKQLGKNLAVNTVSVAGGTGGWLAGAAAGATVGSAVPFVGTTAGGLVGGVIGALAGGSAAGAATKAIADKITSDDSKEMLELCHDTAAHLASGYLLTEQETERFAARLNELIDQQFLRNMYGSAEYNFDRKLWARSRFEPLVHDIIAGRRHIQLPSSEELAALIARVLNQPAQ